MNSHEVFIHIHQGCFAGTGAIVRLPQFQWSKPDGYGKISQCITTTKHSKAKTVCIFLGIYCIFIYAVKYVNVMTVRYFLWRIHPGVNHRTPLRMATILKKALSIVLSWNTYKMPVIYNLSSVWVSLSILSQLSIMQYVGLWFSVFHSLCDDWDNIYTLSYYHHHLIGSMNYYPLFRVRSWNNDMRYMSFYILIRLLYIYHNATELTF